MANLLSDGYIRIAVSEVVDILGVKTPVLPDIFQKYLNENDFQGCVIAIARQLGLPIQIKLSSISENYSQTKADFSSTKLVEVDESGKGVGGITAQVLIPNYLPPFGSPALNDYPIEVCVGEDCIKYPLTFITVMAHELSHVLLKSVGYKDPSNEFHTDITAMVMGFSDIIKEGRVTCEVKEHMGFFQNTTTTTTGTYGYLTDRQFQVAYGELDTALEQKRKMHKGLVTKNKQLKKLLKNYQLDFNKFSKCLYLLDKNKKTKVAVADGKKIVEFHQVGYLEKIENLTKTYVTFSENAANFCNCFLYTKAHRKISDDYKEQLLLSTKHVSEVLKNLKSNVRMLRKYLSIIQNLKLSFNLGTLH